MENKETNYQELKNHIIDRFIMQLNWKNPKDIRGFNLGGVFYNFEKGLTEQQVDGIINALKYCKETDEDIDMEIAKSLMRNCTIFKVEYVHIKNLGLLNNFLNWRFVQTFNKNVGKEYLENLAYNEQFRHNSPEYFK